MIRNLIDTLNIEVYSGAGGNGIVSFRKLKTRKRAVPDGGSGGKGGDVYLRGQTSLDDLHHVKASLLRAARGKDGRKGDKTGEDGAPLIINVPLGTRVLDREQGHLLLEINDTTRQLLITGGKAGHGNSGSPHHSATQGEAGTHLSLTLDYRLPLDVGIVGYANAGKSTLLSRISSARPLIDDYPLTTRSPQIGICDASAQDKDFFGEPLTVVEIPALPSAQGEKFLKHLLRGKLIIYCLDTSNEPLAQQFETLQRQLSAYDESLRHKQMLLVVRGKNTEQPEHIISNGMRIDVVPIPAETRACVALQQKIFQLWQQARA